MLFATVTWLHYMFMIPLGILSVFLVLVILVQRGRGGGLTGALGGMGGQSAFGTKAGDLFTRITIVVAAIWVLLSMASLSVLNRRSATAGLNPNARRSLPSAPVAPGAVPPPATSDGKSGDAGSAVPGEGIPNTETPGKESPASEAPAAKVGDAAAPPAA